MPTQAWTTVDRDLAHEKPDFIDGTQECAKHDPEIFFPPLTGYVHHLPAIRICRRCPLRTACGTWSLNTRQEFGVYGGMSPRQRRAVVAQNGGKW